MRTWRVPAPLTLMSLVTLTACGGREDAPRPAPPIPTLSPLQDQRATVGTQLTFEARSADGILLSSAQWRVNGKDLPSKGATLDLGPLGLSDDGSVVTYRIGEGPETKASRAALLSTFVGTAHPATGWNPVMEAFRAQDAKVMPPPGCVLFTGSSTIVAWDLVRSFPGKAYVNRGFGGSWYRDVLYHSQEVVLKYTPGCVVLYSGDNDIASGVPPAQIAETLRRLLLRLRGNLPDARIVVLGIKPSFDRWHLWSQAQATNALILQFVQESPGCSYVELSKALLGADGRPDPACFIADGLHLSATGYERITALLKPLLP